MLLSHFLLRLTMAISRVLCGVVQQDVLITEKNLFEESKSLDFM